MQWRRTIGLLAVLALLIILSYPVFVAVRRSQRPPRSAHAAQLFEGVEYARIIRSMPRPLVIHVVEIDLDASGARFFVTPGDTSKGMEAQARTASEFLNEYGAQLAVNGNFFRPFRAGFLPWDYYPHSGDPVNVTGLAISDGQRYSSAEVKRPNLCMGDGQVAIRQTICPTRVSQQAVAGDRVLVWNSLALNLDRYPGVHPRTAAAVDETGKTLWLIVVDGRQEEYSEGMALGELAIFAAELGAEAAINLDGGGSSTLAIMSDAGPKLLNSPIHQSIPLQQRSVANHLGIFVHSSPESR